jgi:large subunit ribosomal protein L2
LKNNSGRNKIGQIVLYTRSKAYHRKVCRLVNFNYANFGIPYIIYRFEYDPHRSAFISLVYYYNSIISYTLSINNTYEGEIRNSYCKGTDQGISFGETALLRFVSDNTLICMVEKIPFFGAVYSRAAGTYSLLIQKYLNLNKALVKLRSGKLKFI